MGGRLDVQHITKLSLMAQHFKIADWTSWNEEHHLHAKSAKCPQIVFELLGIRTQAIGLEVDCFACTEEGLLFADGVAESSTAKSDLMCHSCYLMLSYITPQHIEMQRGWLVANQWPWRLHVRSTGTEPCITREPSKDKSDKLLSSKLSNRSTSA